MFFWRTQTGEGVRAGAVYQRQHPNNFVERAEVVWIGKDSFGIPHVRFEVSYVRPDRRDREGIRMLALSSFAERYQPSRAEPAHA